MITKTKIVKLCKEEGTPFFKGTSMETEPTTSEFPSRGKATVEQILSSKINKSQRAGL